MLFSFWLIQPALSAAPAELHECCRRAGKHHCEMGRGSSQGPSLTSAPCPLYLLHGAVVTATAFKLTAATSSTLLFLVTLLGLLVAQAIVINRASTTQSRGPPVLASL